MRVLLIPELYRPRDASANATLNDAVTWVEQWLTLDRTMHVYWLLPHRDEANYDREYVLADRDRVTLIEAEPILAGTEHESLFTESGFSEDQLLALKRGIYDDLGYVDAVIDQLRQGRKDLYKWLLYLAGHRAGEPTPFDVIVNVHDLMLPFKYPSDGYRIDYHRKMEVIEALFADGCWFKARLDASELPVFATEFLLPRIIDEALDAAVMTDSPIDTSRFEERYRPEPRWLHVAGSGWSKKRHDIVMDIAETLYQRYGIRTVVTSMNEIPDEYVRLPWVEAHPEAPRQLYEAILRRGDLAICASEYDTLARTWFEQAASGQVLLLSDQPWIYECVPSDSRLVAPADELPDLAAWAVEHWDEAVAANRTLVEHMCRVRSPERSGRQTYADLEWRIPAKLGTYTGPPERTVVERTVADVDADVIALDELDERGSVFTADGTALLDQTWCSLTDLVFVLRSMGWVDVGNARTPIFRRVD